MIRNQQLLHTCLARDTDTLGHLTPIQISFSSTRVGEVWHRSAALSAGHAVRGEVSLRQTLFAIADSSIGDATVTRITISLVDNDGGDGCIVGASIVVEISGLHGVGGWRQGYGHDRVSAHTEPRRRHVIVIRCHAAAIQTCAIVIRIPRFNHSTYTNINTRELINKLNIFILNVYTTRNSII